MIYVPPTEKEKAMVEEAYRFQYPTDQTFPLTKDSAKRGILADLRWDVVNERPSAGYPKYNHYKFTGKGEDA